VEVVRESPEFAAQKQRPEAHKATVEVSQPTFAEEASRTLLEPHPAEVQAFEQQAIYVNLPAEAAETESDMSELARPSIAQEIFRRDEEMVAPAVVEAPGLEPPPVEIEIAAPELGDEPEPKVVSQVIENTDSAPELLLNVSELPEALAIAQQASGEQVVADEPLVGTEGLEGAPDPIGGDFDWESLLYPSEDAVPEQADFVSFVEQPDQLPDVDLGQVITIGEEAADMSALEVAKTETYHDFTPDVIEVFEQLSEKAETIGPEVLEAAREPVKEALQTIQEI
jgi:hypothetical protein